MKKSTVVGLAISFMIVWIVHDMGLKITDAKTWFIFIVFAILHALYDVLRDMENGVKL